MTGLYDWNPMPHKVDIKCPSCLEKAEFEFAEVVKITLKKDVPFFQNSPHFEYHILSDYCGHKFHGAFFFEGLHGAVDSIINLPEGYSPSDWAHSKYLVRSQRYDIGSVKCSNCSKRGIYNLNWPEDAYYSVSYKNKNLWAFNRESANDLLNFIESNERNESNYRWQSFLRHVPSHFKGKKARADLSKRLKQRLSY